MTEVNIIRLGHPQLNINKAIQVINNSQNRYHLSHKDSIPNLGNSDLHDYAFSDDKLFNLLAPHINTTDLTIGITSVLLEDNWFLRPNQERTAFIITIFEVDSIIEKIRRTLEDYFVYQILICVLTSEYLKRSGIEPSERLLHDDCKGCLFDFCGNKDDICRGLVKLYIDDRCKGILIEGNVPEENIDASLAVLKYMKKPNIRKIIYSIKENPFLSFFIGIGSGVLVNLISEQVFPINKISLNITLVLLPFFGVFLFQLSKDVWQWWRE
jgi:hypothetical protein